MGAGKSSAAKEIKEQSIDQNLTAFSKTSSEKNLTKETDELNFKKAIKSDKICERHVKRI